MYFFARGTEGVKRGGDKRGEKGGIRGEKHLGGLRGEEGGGRGRRREKRHLGGSRGEEGEDNSNPGSNMSRVTPVRVTSRLASGLLQALLSQKVIFIRPYIYKRHKEI